MRIIARRGNQYDALGIFLSMHLPGIRIRSDVAVFQFTLLVVQFMVLPILHGCTVRNITKAVTKIRKEIRASSQRGMGREQ